MLHVLYPEKHRVTQAAIDHVSRCVETVIAKANAGELTVVIDNQTITIGIKFTVPCVDWAMSADTILRAWGPSSLHVGYMHTVIKDNLAKVFLGKTCLEVPTVQIDYARRLKLGADAEAESEAWERQFRLANPSASDDDVRRCVHEHLNLWCRLHENPQKRQPMEIGRLYIFDCTLLTNSLYVDSHCIAACMPN